MRGKIAKALRDSAEFLSINAPKVLYETITHASPSVRKVVFVPMTLNDGTNYELPKNVIRSPHSDHKQVVLDRRCTRAKYKRFKEGYLRAKRGQEFRIA